MYEVFLTALVDDGEFDAACSVLGGLTGMDPWETIYRVLYYHGPPRPAGIANKNSIDKPIRSENGQAWIQLHQNLSRQSYILQLKYEILKGDDMGPNSSPMDLNAAPGILLWTDFPDPPHGRPVLTQRKKVELWEQKKLPSVLRDNSYQFKTEKIEEVHRFFRGDIEFCLSRDYFIRPLEDYIPLERKATASTPLGSLPSWESLTPVDMQKRWILYIKAHVLQDNKPDEIRKAQDQLLAIRTELEGVLDFKSLDRKVHDTRVAQQQQGVQALPQKVLLGKN